MARPRCQRSRPSRPSILGTRDLDIVASVSQRELGMRGKGGAQDPILGRAFHQLPGARRGRRLGPAVLDDGRALRRRPRTLERVCSDGPRAHRRRGIAVVRRERVPEVSPLRRAGARLRPDPLRRLRVRAARAVQLQGPRLLSELRRAAHGRAGHLLGQACLADPAARPSAGGAPRDRRRSPEARNNVPPEGTATCRRRRGEALFQPIERTASRSL